jgi:hypothetical protein
MTVPCRFHASYGFRFVTRQDFHGISSFKCLIETASMLGIHGTRLKAVAANMKIPALELVRHGVQHAPAVIQIIKDPAAAGV